MDEQKRKAKFVADVCDKIAKGYGYGKAEYVYQLETGREYISVFDIYSRFAFAIEVTASSLTYECCEGGISDFVRGMNDKNYRVYKDPEIYLSH